MFNSTLRICLEFDQWVSCQRMTWVIWEYYTTSPCVVSWMPWPYLPQISEHRTKQTTLKKINKLGTHKIWHSNRNITETLFQFLPPTNGMLKVMFSVLSVCPQPPPPVQGPAPRHIQTSSLWIMDCRKAGSSHSTEMPSCLECYQFN